MKSCPISQLIYTENYTTDHTGRQMPAHEIAPEPTSSRLKNPFKVTCGDGMFCTLNSAAPNAFTLEFL